jgi:hypothetical protein
MTNEHKKQLTKELNQLSTARLQAHFEGLIKRRDALSERAKYASDKGIKAACTELTARREAVRERYGKIDLTQTPHVIVAQLAVLQGQEIEILTELDLWKSASGSKKVVDAEVEICENILIERGEG